MISKGYQETCFRQFVLFIEYLRLRTVEQHDRLSSFTFGSRLGIIGALPILGDVEAPFELQMSLLVIVNKARDGVVVPARQHAARGVFLLDWNLLLVFGEGRSGPNFDSHFFVYTGCLSVHGA